MSDGWFYYFSNVRGARCWGFFVNPRGVEVMEITVSPADDAELAWRTARLYSITLSVPGFMDQFAYIDPKYVTESSLRQIVDCFRASVREQLGLRRV